MCPASLSYPSPYRCRRVCRGTGKSLDELPQFINVLQGRMSIVGPRPHAVAHNEEYRQTIDKYMLRHKVKPGITGWAQINGRDALTISDKVDLEIYYLQNRSFWFDLNILCKTLLFVGKRKGISH
ncbi:MAG: sugar transferase [Nitrospinae bacterium]|nr:sugar transferase [Nitrospinota bacterium]